jgi:prepilin-type N-terminal cleavage/methylation domain-containing protein
VKKQDGFTIIELLTVVAIIGVLAVLAISNFNLFKSNAKNAAAASDARALGPGVDLVSTGGVDGTSPIPTIAPFDGTGGAVPGIPGGKVSPGTLGEIAFPAPSQYCIKTEQIGGDLCYTLENGKLSVAAAPCDSCI